MGLFYTAYPEVEHLLSHEPRPLIPHPLGPAQEISADEQVIRFPVGRGTGGIR